MIWPNNLPRPLYVRTSSRVRYMGKDYIVRRDVSGAICYLVGRMTRKLPSMKDAMNATINQKLVCQWGGIYAAYVRVEDEEKPMILNYLWEHEKKRGIKPPDLKNVQLSDEG